MIVLIHFLKHIYDDWFEMKNRLTDKKESVDSSDIPALEGGEEIKEGK